MIANTHSFGLHYLACGPITHTAVSILIVLGMMAAISAKYIFRRPENADALLLIAIGASFLPLAIDLIQRILKRKIKLDVIAGLSVCTAVAIHEFWVAGALILVASGSAALEEYVARRAFSVVRILRRRMPQIAHRIEPDGSTCDVQVKSIMVGNRLLLYAHELSPTDGVVLDGFGSMNEIYLPEQALRTEKGPGNFVVSGAMNGDAPLTIEVTRSANDSQCASFADTLQNLAARAAATSSAWTPNQQLGSRIRRCKAAGELVGQRVAGAFSRYVGHRGLFHAAHG